MRIKHISWIFLFNASYSYAQISPDVGRVLEDQKQFNQLPDFPSRAPLVLPEAAIRPPVKADELRVTVKEFRFSGEIKSFPVTALQVLLADLVGQSLSISDLQEAAERVTTFYRQRGYFLATVLLPKQDVTDGIVTLHVFEGVLDRKNGVKIQGSKLRVKPQVLLKTVQSSIPADEAMHKESLERALLLIGDLPGMTATSRLEAGDEAGGTRVAVQAAEGDLLVPNLALNNHGNIYTGAHQLVAGVSVNDPSGIGDQFSVNFSRSLAGLLSSAKYSYSLPIGSDGLRAGLSYTDVAFRLAGLQPDPQSTGSAQNWTLNARYPVIRSLQRNLAFTASYDWKRLFTDAFQTPVSDKRVDVVALGLNWDHQDTLGGGAFTSASLTGVTGNLDLTRVKSAAQADANSAQTAGRYNKWLWSLSRMQRLSEDVSLLLQASGQQAGKNLDGGEKFSLGGPSGVRAYPGGEGAGDEGYKFTIEPRWNVGRLGESVEFQLSAFYDMGYVVQNRTLWPTANLPTPNAYSLFGQGVSVALTRPGWADFRITYAHKLGINPGANVSTGADADGRKDPGRVWLTLTMML